MSIAVYFVDALVFWNFVNDVFNVFRENNVDNFVATLVVGNFSNSGTVGFARSLRTVWVICRRDGC